MKRVLSLAVLSTLAACGSSAEMERESVEDYAARVGTSGSAAEGGSNAPTINAAAPVAPPAGSNPTRLERLGDIRGVDLGTSVGNCTFSADGSALLVAAGPADRSLPGKATVRIGGQLLLLDGGPGGYGGVVSGNTYRGEGFAADLEPAGGDNAKLTITDDSGETRTVAGKWACT